MSNAIKARWCKRTVVVSYITLLILLTLGTWFLHPAQREPSLTIWVIRMVPLLIFIPGMYRDNLRSYAWLCFVVLMYFTISVTDAMAPYGSWLHYLQVAVTVVLFNAAMLYIRWQARALRGE